MSHLKYNVKIKANSTLIQAHLKYPKVQCHGSVTSEKTRPQSTSGILHVNCNCLLFTPIH